MSKFIQWQLAHDQAVEDIKMYLAKDCEAGHLCRWLFESKHNPYSISSDYASVSYSAQLFSTFCGNVFHAIHDDGDIIFYSVNEEPSFLFTDKDSERFIKATAPTYASEAFRSLCFDLPHEVVILKDAYEFTKAYDKYNAEWLKKCFFTDAKRMGIEFAVKHYDTEDNKDVFQDSWIAEVNKDYDEI